MKYELPDFDTLLEISKTDPHALDRIKQEAAEALIDEAPEASQRRLRGLQFQVDMELRRSKSNMDGCIRVSRMMQESLGRLRTKLNHAVGEEAIAPVEEVAGSAEILPFQHSYS